MVLVQQLNKVRIGENIKHVLALPDELNLQAGSGNWGAEDAGVATARPIWIWSVSVFLSLF